MTAGEPGKAVPYSELPGLRDFYFEDSWVTDVRATAHELAIDVEAVLTPSHPEFGPPEPGKMYRYRNVTIRFLNVVRMDWTQPLDLRPGWDATGAVDYGNIDFIVQEGESYRLGGDWGEVTVLGDPPVVEPIGRQE